jgi:hypothetical protein
MKKIAFLSSMMLISSLILISSCKKDEDPTPPTISFKSGTGFVSADATLAFDDSIVFGINAKSNGSDKLVKFQILANGNTLLDSTISTLEFNIEVHSTKTILDKEVWKFVVTDLAGNSVTDSITLTAVFGEVNTFSSIILGAQSKKNGKGFLSFSNSAVTTYTMDEAFNHQADIDMFLFYENDTVNNHINLMTMAAPGSNITGIFAGTTAPEFYDTKNVTYFTKTELSTAEFDAVTGDKTVLASFDPDNKFKKAKLLAVGDVYAFKLQSGKYGLLKVTAVDGEDDGTVEFTVKIQK